MMAVSLRAQSGAFSLDRAFRCNSLRSRGGNPVSRNSQWAQFCQQAGTHGPIIRKEICQLSHHVIRGSSRYKGPRRTTAIGGEAGGLCSKISSNAVRLSRPKPNESSRGGTLSLSLKRGVQKCPPVRNVGVCKSSLRTEHAEGISAGEEPAPEVGDVEEPGAVEEESKERSLFLAAGVVGLATVGAKILGLGRESTLAAAFGVGPVMNAYSYASILPTFLISMLGGINGPFHSAITAALARRSPPAGRALVEKVSTLVLLTFTLVSLVIFLNAPALVDLAAPGLMTSAEGAMTSAIAVAQLRVMAPCALLAALLGVGFGSLNSAGVYALPSLSPALSSGSIIAAVLFHCWRNGGTAGLGPHNAMAGGIAVASGFLAGATLQWAVQAATQLRLGLGTLRLQWANPLTDPGLREVLAVMVPGAVASGMLQIATYTDLHFASFLPGAAAALGYANLLVQAPLGILSSALLVPILPLFAKSSAREHWPELRRRIRQGVILAAAVTLPLTAIMAPLSTSVVRVLLQRKAFDTAATALVAPLVVGYQLGAIAYLIRDVLVRVFYALGDGATPFYTSIAAILANVVLDWLAVRKFDLGAQGLILATLSVNAASGVILLAVLSRRVNDLRTEEWVRPLLTMVGAAVVAAYATALSHAAALRFLMFLAPLVTPPTLMSKATWFAEFSACGCASIFSLATFVAVLVWTRLPEADAISVRLRKKLGLQL
ncbi:integral membrane protein MviN [Klebsormidium nitens]|uniref:Integral membrane protein MviN n=1 Tax=Klebsormidium nitens TaxID=105231 RepID=A0A1Y1IAL8_KLENI|nr:integral membrane protein MviN [Klebsormidium nitens]|eukprot:GAQ85148.1 integral membrane protein MviN [Klebsormidium nitens]